jgi:hypothetical protein
MTDVDEAERLSSQRPGMLMVMTGMFLFQQFAYFTQPPATGRAVDYVRIGAWIFLALVVLAALLTGGFWQKSKAVRALMEDDVTRANRADALRLGFGLAMAAAIGLFAFSGPGGLTAREVIHIIVSAGLGASLLRFGFLERRAHRVG